MNAITFIRGDYWLCDQKKKNAHFWKKKIEEKRKALFTFKPTINTRYTCEQGNKDNL